MDYLSWWLGGIGLATVGLLFRGQRFGFSGSLERALFAKETIDIEASKAFFANKEALSSALNGNTVDPQQKIATKNAGKKAWLGCVGFVAGGFLGGAIDAYFFSGFEIQMRISQIHQQIFGDGIGLWLILFFGGLLVGWGTRLAGGCTSGHGLSGCGHLERYSLLATAIFFGSAIVVTRLLIVFLMGSGGVS